MTTDPPPDSSMFDSLWEGDEDEADLPPALSGGLLGRRPPPVDRETLPPPAPAGPHAHAQSMMHLAEHDDPSGGPAFDGRATTPRPPNVRLAAPRPYTPTPGRGMGAVRAAETELFLDDDALPGSSKETPRPGGIPAAVAARRNATTARVRPRSSPAFAAVPPRAGAAVATARLPVPRAPSIPPSPDPASDFDVIEGFDPLDVLDSSPFHAPHASHAPHAGRTDLATLPPPTPPPDPPSSSRPRLQESPSTRAPGSATKHATGRRTAPPVGLRLGPPTPRSTPNRWPSATALDEMRAALAPEDEDPTPEPARVSEPPSSVADHALEMQALFDAKNYSSALVLAESVLASNPAHAHARRCAESCRDALAQKYLDRLGGRDDIPRVVMTTEEIRVLALDHRAGFLLSFIDGSMSIEEVLDVSSMPALDALRLMYELREQGAIEIVEPNRRPGRR